MARPYPSDTLMPKGKLEISEVKPGLYRAFFTPPAEALPTYVSEPSQYTRPIFDVNIAENRLMIYPYGVWSNQAMSNKYYHLYLISVDIEGYWNSYHTLVEEIEEFLARVLPSAFVEDYNYGLRFRKAYRHIVSFFRKFRNKGIVHFV